MLTYIVVSAIAVGIMIYVGYHMVSSFSSDVETSPAYIDVFTESVTLDAYILRHEEVLYSDHEGILNFLVADGAKVARGDKLADVYRNGDTGIRSKIDAIDKKIEELELIGGSAEYLSASDAAGIDAQIRDLLLAVRKGVTDDDFMSASRGADSMLLQMRKRLLVTGELESFDHEIAALKSERERLVSEMTDVAETVKTSKSAYYYYDVDGYENSFSFDSADSLTAEDLRRMTTAENAKLTGCEAGKLVLDYKWYAAVKADRESAEFFAVGRTYTIGFGADGRELEMKAERTVYDEENGDAFVIFSSDSIPDDFGFTRMQPITVNVRSYTGIRVPYTAIRVVDYGGEDVTGVYILYGNTVHFRRIDIILRKDGYVLASVPETETDEDGWYAFPEADGKSGETETVSEAESVQYLQVYDMIIISAKNLYDGKIISK